LIELYDFQEKDNTPFTPGVQAFYALDAALDELLKEGVARRRARYASRARKIRNGLISLGFETFLPLENYSSSLASFKLPADIGYKELHDELKNRGFVVYAAQALVGDRVFRVANMGELSERHTKDFLAAMKSGLTTLRRKRPPKVIILAAGVGKRLNRIPKPLIKFGANKPALIERNISNLLDFGLNDIVIVSGYFEDEIKKVVKATFGRANIRFIQNPVYESSGSGYSLLLAERVLTKNNSIIMDADILFDKRILNFILNCSRENALLVDPRSKFTGEEVSVFARDGMVIGMGKDMRDPTSYVGETIGIYRFSKSSGKKIVMGLKTTLKKKGRGIEYENVFDAMSSQLSIYPTKIPDIPWIEIDTKEDLARAKRFILPKIKGCT